MVNKLISEIRSLFVTKNRSELIKETRERILSRTQTYNTENNIQQNKEIN